MTIRSQPAQDNEIQDKVTANALDWMIVNCETPRSVDITLQSLAAADEKLPIKDLEKHHAWVMIRQRLKRMNMDKRSEQNQKAVDLYARAVQFYLDTKSKTDMLHYESIGFLPEKERQVVRIRATIRSLIDELLLHVNHEDVTQVLNRCSSIGRSLLSQAGQLVRGDNSGSDGHGPGAAIEPVGLAEDLVNRLEKYLKGEVAFDSDLYRTLSASFAFVLWCNAAQDPTAQSINIGYVRRLIRARSLGSEKTASEFEQTIAPSLALGTLWLLLSSRHSDEHLDDELLPEPLEYFWATLMTVAYSDSSALKDLDVTYLAHGMLYLLANPGEYNLSVEDCVTIESVLDQTVYSLSGKFPVKIQSVCHARYIYCLNRNIAIIDDKSAFASQVFRAVHNLRYYSPWDDYYILPSSGAYVLLLNQLCKNSNNDFYTYRILAYSPIPKISPQLVQEISLSDLITHLSAAVDSEDQDIQLFATAQLWVFFNMSMCDADRTSHTLSALETELLKHPGLDNNLERQEAVADELETKLMGIDEVSYLLEDYIYRIREVIMQRRSTPLPRSIDSKLKLIPERLRGIKSFVNFETERSVAYPDLVFDSEGRPSRVSPPPEE
ncbi:unnamed protein product [Rhizoctonia solani]|uniref:Uncharacterized protein n=1 Tax=Rhizoctonia solani TaxID=456999 RepID=A0A8H3DYX4_9AGAM|nr:unnamed protein product [Rhizoctonia solani]